MFLENEIEKFRIEEKIKEYLYFDNPEYLSLEYGMNHITFSPCKRFRPLLLVESNIIFSPLDEDSYILCSAVELIHTYSLVHDDLPSMDDDDLRRGVKTVHKLKNEAYGVLVGDALLTRVFDILSFYTKIEKLPQILRFIGEKSGYRGMIKGQLLDLDGENKNLDIEAINKINEHKTCNLIQLSLLLGAINGGASFEILELLNKLGYNIGMIFQIKDDILDIIGDTEKLGKNVGSDQKKQKSSIPLVIGIEKAYQLINHHLNIANEIVKDLPGNKQFFIELLDFLINREK